MLGTTMCSGRQSRPRPCRRVAHSLISGMIIASLLALTACSGVAQGFGLRGTQVTDAMLCPDKSKRTDGPITIVDLWWPFQRDLLNSAAPAFNCEFPDIAINLSVNGQVGDDSNGKLLAAVSARKPPDLVMAYDDVLTAWAAKGLLQPIDDRLPALGIRKDDYIAGAWDSTLWRDHQYGIPADWDPDSLLWYNKALFAEAGLDPERPPTTWQEVQEYAAKIDKIGPGGKIERLGLIPWSGWQFNYIQLAQQFNAPLHTGMDPDRVVLDSPQMRQVFEYQYEIAKKYGGGDRINAFLTVSGAQGAASDPLLSGRVGMRLIGDWQLAYQEMVGTEVFRSTMGVTAMPPPPGGRPFLTHSGWAFMVPRGAQNVDAALTFSEWLLRTENFGTYVGPANGWLPAKKETRSQPYLTSDPTWRKILEIDARLPQEPWLPPSPILAQYYRFADAAQSDMTSLVGTPEQVLVKAQRQLEDARDNAVAAGVYD